MSKQSILIVEDEPIIAADLRDRLEEKGFTVLGSFDTGEAAVEFVRRHTPDLVLMDVNLAGTLDGVEAALAIRQIATVSLIFLTSNSDSATFGRARAARPQAFLSKPFRGRDLTNAIELALGVDLESGLTNAPTSSVPKNNTESAGNQSTVAPTEGEEKLEEGQTAAIFRDRLFIKVKERLVRLMLSDILYVEADDYYCKVVTEEREYLATKTLKKLGMLLPNDDFLRCHRSYIINVKRVTEIGEIYVFMGKHKAPISRSKRTLVLERLQNL